jgi:chromosome segregation ATPase
MADRKPVTRSQLKRELVVNAVTKPLNIAVPAAVVVAAIVIGAWWLVVVAVLVHAALAAQTFFDEKEAEKVGDRVYGRRKQVLGPLAPAIRAQVDAARGEQAAIARTIEASDLSWADVRSETAQLVAALEAAARRAQPLSDYLERQDAAELQRRIADCRDPETGKALKAQYAELERLEGMLQAAFAEMEQVNASLKTVHARLVGAAAGSDVDLAGDVRELRERVETLTADLRT